MGRTNHSSARSGLSRLIARNFSPRARGSVRGKLNIFARQGAWSSNAFSDPNNHQVDGVFRYVVNAVVEYKDEPAYITNLLQNPNLIQQNLLSTSVIDQNNTNVWGASGFVLRVPERNVIAASNTDIATQNRTAQQGFRPLRDELKRLHRAHGLPSPDDIVRPSIAEGHNEIAVLGSVDLDPRRNDEADSAVTIAAIYIIVAADYQEGDVLRPVTMYTPVKDESGSNYVRVNDQHRFLFRRVQGVSEKRMGDLQRIADELGIPIVPIRHAPGAKIGAAETVLTLPPNAILEDSEEYRPFR